MGKIYDAIEGKVEDFIRRSHQVRFSPAASMRKAPAAAKLAEIEGLPGHAASARLRALQGDGE